MAAADPSVLEVVSAELADGRFLDAASSRLPTVVLGADAARRLGIDHVGDGVRVWLGGQWFAVIGILEPAPLAPDLDAAALIGYEVADELFETTRSPSTLYVRTVPDQVEEVRDVLARSVDPESPNEVDVSRPSDALAARATTDAALRNLLLGLGAVALVVGGVGITNVLVISVLERRGEIGVRRALGARRRHVAGQFLVEAGVLALLGGLAGVTLGSVVTAVYARRQGWLIAVPVGALTAGVGLALVVGLLAGVSPADPGRPPRSCRRHPPDLTPTRIRESARPDSMPSVRSGGVNRPAGGVDARRATWAAIVEGGRLRSPEALPISGPPRRAARGDPRSPGRHRRRRDRARARARSCRSCASSSAAASTG